jgi:hypothetical protein
MTETDASIVPALQAVPDTERLYENRKRRRAWLLSNALENLPLKAPALAAAAERFFSETKLSGQGRGRPLDQ